MDENYAVMYRNEQVGKLQMQRQGLYCRMQCRCQLPGDDIYRLKMVQGKDSTHIGVLVPEGDGFLLDKRIPAKRIPAGELHFVVRGSREPEEPEEPVIDIEAKEEITFDDFEKMQFQVGEIISCEAVKKSRKLLCSQVKIGSQVKQIVSGIKAHYTPEEMVGKKVMVLVNLKPAKLAGVLSEGMLLCAEDADGNLSLMVPEKEMPAGAEIC